MIVEGKDDEARFNFGVSPNTSEEVRIKPKFSIKVAGENSFMPLFFASFGELVVPPYTHLSNVIDVTREDLRICNVSFTLKVEVDEVRIGGQLIDSSEYNVLSFNFDGSSDLGMLGPGCGSSSQVPGNNSWDPIFKEVLYNQVYQNTDK